MKSIRLIMLLPLMLASCGFFKDYTKDNQWSYFEEWDLNADSKVDREEFVAGCLRDGFIRKSDDPGTAEALFNKADEDKDGALTGLEFYRWKIDYTDAQTATSL